MTCKAKLLLLETVVFAVAAILYGFLFYDTYCEFYDEVVSMAVQAIEPIKDLATKETDRFTVVEKAGGDTSA